MALRHVLIATSNAGKLRDFAGAAAAHGIAISGLPGFGALSGVAEDGGSFEENARRKAEHYSRFAPGEIVLADDSGLEVDALNDEPGVLSARYAAEPGEENSSDEANNARLLRELAGIPRPQRTGRFVCVIAAARDGRTLAIFRGTAEGVVLDTPVGFGGFGYDPLFYFPPLGKTLAQLSPEEKATVSHRGAAFRQFLDWADAR